MEEAGLEPDRRQGREGVGQPSGEAGPRRVPAPSQVEAHEDRRQGQVQDRADPLGAPRRQQSVEEAGRRVGVEGPVEVAGPLSQVRVGVPARGAFLREEAGVGLLDDDRIQSQPVPRRGVGAPRGVHAGDVPADHGLPQQQKAPVEGQDGQYGHDEQEDAPWHPLRIRCLETGGHLEGEVFGDEEFGGRLGQVEASLEANWHLQPRLEWMPSAEMI